MSESQHAMAIHKDVGDDAQLSIETRENVEGSTKVDEGDELLADQIQVTRKINSNTTIKALHLKPPSLSCMMVPLYRLVAMPIVRPTLFSNLASLEANFVYGYWEVAVVFNLSTTNEGGLVIDEDFQSWDPLWYIVNTRFEDYLSFVPELKHLKDVKFSI